MTPAHVTTLSLGSDGESDPRLPLDAIFAPRTVAVIGATEKQGSVGRAVLWNLISNPFGGTVYPDQLEPAQRAGDQGVQEHRRGPRPGRPGGGGHARADGARRDQRVRRGRREGGDHHLGRVQGDRARRGRGSSRRCWRRHGAAGCGSSAQLPGRDAPLQRHERDLRRPDRPARHGRIHQPERRPLHGDPRLELPRERRLQRVHLDRLDARCRLGRPDRLSGRRSLHQVHRDLHGIDRRRAVVPVGLARGGADQADHRDQGRAARRRRPRRPPRTPGR